MAKLKLPADFETNGRLKDTDLKKIAKLDFILPVDYMEFMKEHDGGEGGVGENSYLVMWKIKDLVSLNKAYETALYAPGYFIFGSDGGGTAYAFHKKSGKIVSFEFIGMTQDEAPVSMGKTLAEFIRKLESAD